MIIRVNRARFAPKLYSVLSLRASPHHFALAWIGFLNDLFYGRSYIAAPAELSIPVLLDEKSTVVPVRLAGEQSGGKRNVSYGDGRSNSERAALSACVGRRLSAPQIVWNRSTRRAGARGGPRVGRPR